MTTVARRPAESTLRGGAIGAPIPVPNRSDIMEVQQGVDKDASGVKYDEGKLRFDLLPVRPLEEVARVYTIGAKKYADRNWEKGLQWGRVFAAMMRHAWAWWRGEKHDPKDGQHHLASVAWCALALMEYEETHQELDDRPATLARQQQVLDSGTCVA